MGWGRMFLLGNVGQQMDLDDLEQEISTPEGPPQRPVGRPCRSPTGKLEQSRRRTGRAKALRRHDPPRARVQGSGFSSDELGELIRSIDAEDGRTDNAYRDDIAP